MNSIYNTRAIDLAELVKTKHVTPVELARAFIERIDRMNSHLNAFVHVDPELSHMGSTNTSSPLAGVPFAAKALSPIAGWPFDQASMLFKDRRATTTDSIVNTALLAGMPCIGTTNVPEFGMAAYSESKLYAAARTPWDFNYCAGGSSGGAASAVAASLIPIALGSDAAGSIRIPASVNGVVGFKPSRRDNPDVFNAYDPNGWLVHGPIARSVFDIAAFLDATGWSQSISLLDSLKTRGDRLRIGVCTTNVYNAPIDENCAAAVHYAATALSRLHHHVTTCVLPSGEFIGEAFMELWAYGASTKDLPHDCDHRLTPLVRYLRMRGSSISPDCVTHNHAVLARYAVEYMQAFHHVDVILTPTLAQSPRRVGQLRNDQQPAEDVRAQCLFSPYAATANITGQPAITLPLFVDNRNRPIGVQLTAKNGRDELLLGLCAELERNVGFVTRTEAR